MLSASRPAKFLLQPMDLGSCLSETGSFSIPRHTPYSHALKQYRNDHVQCSSVGDLGCITTVRKRSCRKVMFLYLSVSHSVHGGGASDSVYAGIPLPGRHTIPLDRHSPWADAPGRHPPLADGYCSGWYASYWNAFLFYEIFFKRKKKEIS